MNKIKIEIIGKNPDYFLKEIIKKNINIYDLEKNYKSIKLIINTDDFKTIKKIKTTYKIKVIEKYGVLKLYDYLKKYNLLLLFMIIGIIINILLSNIIFKVEVIHPNKELVKIIYKDLNDLGLKKYHFKINKNKVKEKLLEKEKNKIEWLEIENIGTKYIIRLEEKKLNKKEKVCRARHIISKKQAIVYSIESSSGEIIKKKNDYVEKGEILISGFIHNKEKIVSKKCAIGKVYGETWYNVKIIVPTTIKNIKVLDNKDYGINIKIFKKDINIGNKLSTYKKYVYNIIDSRIIPISIGIIAKKPRNKIWANRVIAKVAMEMVMATVSGSLAVRPAIPAAVGINSRPITATIAPIAAGGKMKSIQLVPTARIMIPTRTKTAPTAIKPPNAAS